jgi:hypothetical protein
VVFKSTKGGGVVGIPCGHMSSNVDLGYMSMHGKRETDIMTLI